MLRRVHADHAEAIAAAVGVSLEELRPWMAWATQEAAEPRTQLIRVAEADELWEAGSDFIYSVLLRPGPTVVGEIGLHRRVGDGGMEIGYWVDSRFAGNGIGTEAARLLTGAALALDGVTRVEIHCDEANQASAAIPRKLGYRLDRIDRITPRRRARSAAGWSGCGAPAADPGTAAGPTACRSSGRRPGPGTGPW